MNLEELRNKIGMQIRFLKISGLDENKVLENLVNIAVEFSNHRELEVRKQLDFMRDNQDTYQELDDNFPYISCPNCCREFDSIDIEYRRCSRCGFDVDEDEEGGNNG